MPTTCGVYGDGAALLAPPVRQAPPRRYPTRHLPAVTWVSVDYSFSEPFGQAEVNYCFEAGHLFPLEGGYVVPVERVQPGMRFHLDNGAVATVTAVKPPKVWPLPPPEPDADGNSQRRVIGRIKRTGFMVLDLVFGGQTITTTPGHLIYSIDRRGWVGAEALHVGEALLNDKGQRLRLDGKSRIRHGFVELYNIEVEQLHTFFVGRTPGEAALVHNGTPVPGAGGCIPKPVITNKLDDADAGLHRARHLEGVTVKDGKLLVKEQPLHNPNHMDLEFVVGMEGNLVLGYRHQHLAKVAGDKLQVQAAGRLNVKRGKISEIDNGSGHFLPTEAEALRYPELLKGLGLDVKGARLTIYAADESVPSGVRIARQFRLE